MKYRRLTKEELEELKPEFIQFLSANGIDAPMWEDIKSKSPEEAEEKIELFSDVVFQKSLENIKFLDLKSSTNFKLFYFAPKQAHLISIKSNELDLLKIKKLTQQDLDKIEVYNAKKDYAKSREEEIFELMEQGCSISNGELFKQFAPLLKLELKNAPNN